MEVTSETRIYMRHIRQAKLCASGVRFWWREKGLDWNDFLENGISETDLAATKDAHAYRVIAVAKADTRHGR